MKLSHGFINLIWASMLVLTLSRLTWRVDGGKGKVPIYMPIPIPVPMPMGPKPPFAHQPMHSHHQDPQTSSNDGEGDVKKIYILQPMPGVKGSMGGHGRIPQPLPHPKMYQTQSRPVDSMDYGGHEGSGQSVINQPSSHNKHQESLKILPIVVIPPIAPMTPIQLSPGSHHQNEKGSRPRYRHSGANERKSFADYAGSGDDMLRDGPRSYRSLMRSIGGMRFRRPMQPSYGQASRLRLSLLDDIMDDYELGPSTWQASSQSLGDSRRPYSRSRHRYNSERFNPRVNSIQDVLDQTIFDDEPTSGLEEYRGSSQISRHECCGPGYASGLRYDSNRRLQSLLEQTSDMSSDQRLVSRENSNEKDAIQMSGSSTGLEKYRLLHEERAKIPGIHHLDIEGALQDSPWDSQYNSALTDREIGALNRASPLDHDEWKYESIKSITFTNLNDTSPHNGTLASFANPANVADPQPPNSNRKP